MSQARFGWTASGGLFLGGVTTVLQLAHAACPGGLDLQLSFIVWILASFGGIGLSLTALFLRPLVPDPLRILDHPAATFLGLALNLWPWLTFVALAWFFAVGPEF